MGPEDRCGHSVYLTETGTDLLDDLLPKIIEQKELYFKDLNRDKLESLVSVLQKVEHNMTSLLV